MEQHPLAIALELARKGRGHCAPNPAVGAVLVKDQQILSQGYHHGFGQAHAERSCLSDLSTATTAGATLYVTLEPCCHHGKTPPCTELILEKKIAKVIYGFEDPNPLVAGHGAVILKTAGIACERENHDNINEFYQSYAYWHRHKQPWVTLKLALSLDGKIAGEDFKPQKITHEKADALTHRMRQESDAILTTVKTIQQDDPQLNARVNQEIISKTVYVLDRHLQLPVSAKILKSAKEVICFYDGSQKPLRLAELTAQGCRCVGIHSQHHQLSLLEALRHIGENGVHDLWVEAGGICAQNFIEQGLANKCMVYLSPIVLGDKAINAFQKPLDLSQHTKVHWQPLGVDALCEIEWES